MADRTPCNKKPLAEQEAWLIDPAWEGAMRQFDQGTQNRRDVLLAKESVAWFADVRALGYLRPPWALAFDQHCQRLRHEELCILLD